MHLQQTRIMKKQNENLFVRAILELQKQGIFFAKGILQKIALLLLIKEVKRVSSRRSTLPKVGQNKEATRCKHKGYTGITYLCIFKGRSCFMQFHSVPNVHQIYILFNRKSNSNIIFFSQKTGLNGLKRRREQFTSKTNIIC